MSLSPTKLTPGTAIESHAKGHPATEKEEAGRASHGATPAIAFNGDSPTRPAVSDYPTLRCICEDEYDVIGCPVHGPNQQTHVVMFSGGAGSWAAAERVAEQHGTENLHLVFADTLIEDQDLYRFLIEGAASIYGIDATALVKRTAGIPAIGDARRALYLTHMWSRVHEAIPNLHPLVEGRDIWQVFKDNRFLGNSRLANCSKFLKQQPARAWLEANTNPANTHVYVGIDWTEVHRLPAVVNAYKPWRAHGPLTEKPYVSKEDVWGKLKAAGIRRPRLYDMGMAHNNCGGFCVRAGQAQFAILLRTNRELYMYHEQKEDELRKYLDKNVAVMRDRSRGWTSPLTMRGFREQMEMQLTWSYDEDDIGGCGCFVDEPVAA